MRTALCGGLPRRCTCQKKISFVLRTALCVGHHQESALGVYLPKRCTCQRGCTFPWDVPCQWGLCTLPGVGIPYQGGECTRQTPPPPPRIQDLGPGIPTPGPPHSFPRDLELGIPEPPVNKCSASENSTFPELRWRAVIIWLSIFLHAVYCILIGYFCRQQKSWRF